MNRKPKGKKHRRKQKGTSSKGIVHLFLLTAAALVIVILFVGFLAFRNRLSPAHESNNLPPQPTKLSEKAPVNQESAVAYQELNYFPTHCFRARKEGSFVITSQQEYEEISSRINNKSDLCKHDKLPEIDFNKHVLLLGETIVSGCTESLKRLKTNAYRDDKVKKIVYEIIFEDCNLDVGAFKPFAVLFPKLSGYTVGIKIVEVSPFYKDDSSNLF